MRAHTKKHHIEQTNRFRKTDTPMSADIVIKKICGDRPYWAVALRGLRYKEGLTQAALGELLGVNRTDISQMEQGKKPIGKAMAQRLAKLFKSDYRIFL